MHLSLQLSYRMPTFVYIHCEESSVSQQATLEETIQQLQNENDLRMQKEVKNMLFSLD